MYARRFHVHLRNGSILIAQGPVHIRIVYPPGCGLAADREAIDPADVEVDPEMIPSIVELAHYNLQQGTLSMRAASAAGVKIALGADRSGVSGDDVALEVLRMVHHGLSVEQVLIAATRTAAQALGLERFIGTVESGRLADLVVLDGDVLAEPELLLDRERIWLVLQLGEPVAGAAFERTAPGFLA
jgi:imidazolonepropionase-like amidohydrolase